MELFSSLKKGFDGNDIVSGFGKEPKPVIFHSVEYQLETIVDKINNLDNLDENEIKQIIIRQHSMILNYDLFLKSDETRRVAQNLFTNVRFLKLFNDIVGLLDLSRDEIICANKLAYDYYVSPNNDKEVSELLLMISYQINSILVIKLSGKLGINGARILSMISNSSFKEEKNVHRVNTFLVRCGVELSIQDVVDIYCILYDRFTYPFVYTMLEVKRNDFDPIQLKNFDTISIAILTIVSNMTSQDIKSVMLEYGYTIRLLDPNTQVRFSIKKASSWARIIKIITAIEDEYSDIVIP